MLLKSTCKWVPCCLLLLSAAPALSQPRAAAAALTLEEAVSTAMAHNPSMARAEANLDANREAAKAVRAENLPSFTTSYAYTSLADQPYAVFNGNKVAVDARNTFHWDLSVKQPLFTGFALDARTKMAALGVEVGKVERQLAILDLTEEVSLAYYRIFQQKQLLQVAEETVVQLTAHAADAGHFYEQGLIPYNDLLKSKVALNNAEQERLQARSDLEMSVAGLNTLLGLPLEQPTEIVDLKASPAPLPDLAPLVEEAQASRPETQALQLALQRNDQEVRLAESSFYPNVDLEGIYERAGDDPAASNNDYANEHNASIGVKATWTFFEWGRTRARVNSRRREHDAMAAQLDLMRDAIRLQVKRSWLQLKVALASIATSEEARTQAVENFRITRLQYQKSLATSSDVLDARALLSQAEANASNAVYSSLSAAARLERALGHSTQAIRF